MPADNPRSPDRGFTLFVASLALVISVAALLAVAFKLNDTNTHAGVVARGSMPMMSYGSGAAARSATVESVKIVVKSDEEHGKMGADGNWHDAFLPADFTVKPGSMVRVTVYNYDDAEHTFTAPGLGTDAKIAGGSETKPGVTTFTFQAPAKAGRYEWFCALPCDPWAMSHDGFMRGFVSVT